MLTRKQRKISILIVFLSVIVSIFEVIALSSTAIFVSALLEPDILTENRFIIVGAEIIGDPTNHQLVTILGVTSSILLLLGLGLSFLMQALIDWLGLRISRQLVNRYTHKLIYAPYNWITQQSAPKTAQRVFTDPSIVGTSVFPAALELLYTGLLTIVSIILLAVAAPWHNLLAIAVLVTVNLLVILFIRPFMRHYSDQQRKSTMQCTKLGLEFIAGAKEIQVRARESYFIGQYDQSYFSAALNRMKLGLLNKLTPLLFMLIGQTGLISLALLMHQSSMGRAEMAGYMALLVVIVGRLLPLISRTFGTVNKLAAAKPYVDALKEHFSEIEKLHSRADGRHNGRLVNTNWSMIELDQVGYSYPSSQVKVIHGVSMEIRRGGSYGLVGRSGSGKTTLIDLILGLYKPDSGQVLIDGRRLSSLDQQSWYNRIGYVPQVPFISNDTLRRNVAFGLPDNEIKDDHIQDCLSRAGLIDVVQKLEDGLETVLGDNGLRLSGGQCQRVAIARSLYYKPDLLIMDEATSALDTLTEKAIQETIRSLHGEVTTITIAHRISTIAHCDEIFLIDEGRLDERGKYEHLLSKSALFRDLANQNNNEPAITKAENTPIAQFTQIGRS